MSRDIEKAGQYAMSQRAMQPFFIGLRKWLGENHLIPEVFSLLPPLAIYQILEQYATESGIDVQIMLHKDHIEIYKQVIGAHFTELEKELVTKFMQSGVAVGELAWDLSGPQQKVIIGDCLFCVCAFENMSVPALRRLDNQRLFVMLNAHKRKILSLGATMQRADVTRLDAAVYDYTQSGDELLKQMLAMKPAILTDTNFDHLRRFASDNYKGATPKVLEACIDIVSRAITPCRELRPFVGWVDVMSKLLTLYVSEEEIASLIDKLSARFKDSDTCSLKTLVESVVSVDLLRKEFGSGAMLTGGPAPEDLEDVKGDQLRVLLTLIQSNPLTPLNYRDDRNEAQLKQLMNTYLLAEGKSVDAMAIEDIEVLANDVVTYLQCLELSLDQDGGAAAVAEAPEGVLTAAGQQGLFSPGRQQEVPHQGLSVEGPHQPSPGGG